MPSNNKHNKINYYRITIIEDLSHKHLWDIRLTKNGFFITIISVFMVLSAIIFSLIAFTPIKSLLPGVPNENDRIEALQNAITIDSLQNVIKQWNFYTENLKKVIEGEDPIKIDSIIKNTPTSKILEAEAKSLQEKDSLLRKQVEQREKAHRKTQVKK